MVKVFATMRYPDPYKPWTKQAPSEVTATGVVIEGHRILTNAHVVLYASQLQIQANQAGDKLSATVVAVAPGMDLAVLKLDDDSFFAAHAPLARAKSLPHIKDAVLAYGYPTGGQELSITKGIVSRIEFAPYDAMVAGLRVQVDAAINAGNSGGPAVVGDQMVGLTFSRAGGDTQNIGYIIPNEEIDLFLRDIADGRYDGKPAMYDDLQTLENPALRAYLKLDKGTAGVVVNRPYQSDASYPLKQWDVITRIGDTPIDDQGMISLSPDLRLKFAYRVQQLEHHGKVPLTIVRAGHTLQIQLPVPTSRPSLIPDLMGAYPSYFVYGPLVFTRATAQFMWPLESNSKAMAALAWVRSPLLSNRYDAPDAQRDELVVVSSPMFPDKLSKGYSNPVGAVVASVNGRPVRGLRQLVETLRDLKDEFVVFEMAGRSESLVFSRREVLDGTDGILTDNGVRTQGSPDMQAVWEKKAP
ncbi:MAG: trypsin-like peptidase domain-containing protein [Proteobacteria bacterium]|nr:trypsin-like peptidase domain-containing protein [Pseudomonadota bacterium]